LVVGQDSVNNPVLSKNINDYTQNFILRPVHPGKTDSLFYVVQDGNYKMFGKVATSGWDTEYGYYSNNSIWKVVQLANGTDSLQNFVSKQLLGTNSLAVKSRLYTDNTVFPTGVNKNKAQVYSGWIVQPVAALTDMTNSDLTNVALSAGVLDKDFASATTSYNVYVPVDSTSTSLTGTAKTLSATITHNPVELTSNSSAVLSCVSGDGSSTTNYTFNYKPINFDLWAAGGVTGVTEAARSIPTQWGWKCKGASWAGANATTGGTVRYLDKPAGVFTLGDTLHTGLLLDTIPYKGRIMYTQWSSGVAQGGVYSFPILLRAGVSYAFDGKYEWDSTNPNAATTSTFTFGINTLPNDSGTVFASQPFPVAATDMHHLFDATFTFIPNNSGLYYFTVKNDTPIWGAIADLTMTPTTAVPNTSAQKLFATVSGDYVKVEGTNAGDDVKVYNVSGQLMQELTASSNVTPIKLSTGVYLIKVNAAVLKVVK